MIAEICMFAFTCALYVDVTVYLCTYRDDFVLDKVEQESQARALLDQTISRLQSIAQQNANVVDRMKLMQISRNMVGVLYHPGNCAASMVCICSFF